MSDHHTQGVVASSTAPLRMMMYSIQQQTLAIRSLDDDTQRNTPSKDPFLLKQKVYCRSSLQIK